MKLLLLGKKANFPNNKGIMEVVSNENMDGPMKNITVLGFDNSFYGGKVNRTAKLKGQPGAYLLIDDESLAVMDVAVDFEAMEKFTKAQLAIFCKIYAKSKGVELPVLELKDDMLRFLGVLEVKKVVGEPESDDGLQDKSFEELVLMIEDLNIIVETKEPTKQDLIELKTKDFYFFLLAFLRLCACFPGLFLGFLFFLLLNKNNSSKLIIKINRRISHQGIPETSRGSITAPPVINDSSYISLSFTIPSMCVPDIGDSSDLVAVIANVPVSGLVA